MAFGYARSPRTGAWVALCSAALGWSLGCSSGGGSSDDPSSGPPAYDDGLAPAAAAPLQNLLVNAGFETREGWLVCGRARAEPFDEATSGERVLALDARDACGETSLDVAAAAIQAIPLTTIPELLTVAFQVRVDGYLPANDFNIYLSNPPENEYEYYDDHQVSYIVQREGETGAWNEITLLVPGSELRGLDPASLFLSFQLDAAGDVGATTVYLDDVRVTDGFRALTQPSPVPGSLRGYAGQSRLLFYDTSSAGERSVASMRPDGSDLTLYPRIPAATVEGLPRWFGDAEVTVAQKAFNPAVPSDPTVVPGGGTDLIRYGLAGDDRELVYRTVGEPGTFLFANAFENVAALDVEVRRADWDPARNRGALSVCGRNRSPQFELNSDDLCYLYIIDATTYAILNRELNGFAPAWSASGRLAYYYEGRLHAAQVAGDAVATEVVYQGQASDTLLQVMDWSPDETRLVFAERGSGSALIDGEIQGIYGIKLLDVATGRKQLLLRVDHGNLIPNLSWSPDGEFIVYSVVVSGGAEQVWWLEVATGATGPITTAVDGYGATWRK